jgi:hypothetical protein
MQKKKQLAHFLQDQYKVSVRRCCDVLMICHSAYYYRHHRREDKPLRCRIREIVMPGCVMVTGEFTLCSDAKAGRIITSELTGFIKRRDWI